MARPVLLIAGGSRGIGAATAKMAASRGYDVAINYKSNDTAANEVVAALIASGANAAAIKGDASAEADIERMFDEAAKLGPVTHFVHSSGITGKNSQLVDAATPVIREAIDVNVFGALICLRKAIRVMSIKRGGPGGSVVMISSMAARLGGTNEYVWYAAAKAAVDTMVAGAAREVAKEGVRINAVSPGAIDTEIHEPGRIERIMPNLPMGRVGKTDEVAEAILFLLSDAAAYVNGAVLNVSGGR